MITMRLKSRLESEILRRQSHIKKLKILFLSSKRDFHYFHISTTCKCDIVKTGKRDDEDEHVRK